MSGADWACVTLLAIMNLASAYVFFRIFSAVRVRDVVAEKSPMVASGAQNETSSSRVIGFIGGMIMACFFWGVANVVIYMGVYAPKDVKDFVASIGGFLLSGSALFLPYAVNQLTDVGKAAAKGNAVDKADADKKAEDAKITANKKIDETAAQNTLTADAVKKIVAEAVKAAAGA